MSRGPLEVLRAELESLPVMAAMASVNGVKCDSSEAEANLAQAIAQIEALAEVANRISLARIAFVDRGVAIKGALFAELNAKLQPFTPGQDSEGGGHG